MNVVIIGDIGWQYLYHLGDEAMTEAAIDMLRTRGADSMTLVAGRPEVSEDFYHLPSVTRVGFKSKWSRERNDAHLAKVPAALAEEIEDGTIYAAIRDCDAVLVAGGGNMNSRDYHLLYERLAAKRIAEHFGKPLYVTSQTVGPMLTVEDRERVVEIADYAGAFGCREATTAALMRKHVADPSRVHHTLDDALMLEADDESRAAASTLARGVPYVVASFADHRGTIWETKRKYLGDLASLCRDVAEALDVDVLLAPHAGSLDPGDVSRDQLTNETIEKLADSPRVRATRMITAREDVALLERATLSLSTRYHPLIFSTATATPAVAIAPSYYSSIRMRGAQRNTGFERFVLPTSSLHLVREAALEAAARSPRLSGALEDARVEALSFQRRWWDAVADAMSTGSPVEFGLALEAKTYEPGGAWSTENEFILPVFDEYAQRADVARDLAKSLADEREENERLTKKLATAHDALARLRSRKVVRAANWMSRKLPGR